MLKEAGIEAHHALAAMKFRAFQAHSVGRWQFHIKVAVSSLRTIPVQLDLYDTWNRLIYDLHKPYSDSDRLEEEQQQEVPGTLATSAGGLGRNLQVLLLELTRAHNWGQDWYETTGTFKIQKYKRLQEQMLNLLP